MNTFQRGEKKAAFLLNPKETSPEKYFGRSATFADPHVIPRTMGQGMPETWEGNQYFVTLPFFWKGSTTLVPWRNHYLIGKILEKKWVHDLESLNLKLLQANKSCTLYSVWFPEYSVWYRGICILRVFIGVGWWKGDEEKFGKWQRTDLAVNETKALPSWEQNGWLVKHAILQPQIVILNEPAIIKKYII